MRAARTRRVVASLVVGAFVVTGCASMPTSGPVVERDASTEVQEPSGAYFDPRPPRPGQTPEEVVGGFLEAMRATPIRTSVAKQFLAAAAQDTWAPEQRILTYTSAAEPVGHTTVTLNLEEVNRYDKRGAWHRTDPTARLEFRLIEEDGEWRISSAPDALIVPSSWFEDWYERVSLYFFDPTAQILVPEPVFAPKGDQFATTLVRGLLTPPSDSPEVSMTAFPASLEPGLSVPISRAGVAEVTFGGAPDSIDNDTAQRMLTQLAWTLRQEPRVRAIRLSVGERVFGGPDGAPQVPLDTGRDFDPTVASSSPSLFAIERGRLLTGDVNDLDRVLGPFGQENFRLRSVGVNLAGSSVAGVARDGTRMWLTSVSRPDAEVTRAPFSATDLLPPAWDFRDRLWTVDRGSGSARIRVMSGDRSREVDAPGISGRDVTRFLVSRDGSRLVAVVRDKQADRVVTARVRHDARGRILRVTRAVRLDVELLGASRFTDLAWRSPTSIAVLGALTDDLFQVVTVSVDGAPEAIPSEIASRLLRGKVRSLVSSPRPGRVAMALSRHSVTDLSAPENVFPGLPAGVTYLTYVG